MVKVQVYLLFLCQPGTTQLFLSEEKNRLNKVLDILTITKLYINTNNIIGSIYYGPSCVLKVLRVLIHLILKPYAIGFINIPIWFKLQNTD